MTIERLNTRTSIDEHVTGIAKVTEDDLRNWVEYNDDIHIELTALTFLTRLYQNPKTRVRATSCFEEGSKWLENIIPNAYKQLENTLEKLDDSNESVSRYETNKYDRTHLTEIFDYISLDVLNELSPPHNDNPITRKLSERLLLSNTEKDLVEKIIYLSLSLANQNHNAFSEINNPTTRNLLLSVGLNLPLFEVKKALDSNGKLSRLGLLEDDNYRSDDLFDIRLDRGLSALYRHNQFNPTTINDWLAPTARKAKTNASDYFYLKKEVNACNSLLRAYKSNPNMKPPQIMFWGLPGTGKTELAKLCLQSCFKTCLEVPFSRKNESISSKERFNSYLRLQSSLLMTSSSAVIFDEADGIFDDRENTLSQNKGKDVKALLNKTLEEPSIPSIWITNSVSSFDAAYLRRFDLIIQFDHLEPMDAEIIVKANSKGLRLRKQWISELCNSYKHTPAVLTDAIATANQLNLKGKAAEEFIELKISELVEGQKTEFERLFGQQKDKKYRKTGANKKNAINYRPELSNTSIALPNLIRSLQQHQDARILFYGAPGTGKTAFAQHLSKQLKLPARYYNAGEFLNMFLGVTEEKIREAFPSNASRRSLVIVDEADTLLRPRAQAAHSWEVSQVNQFLSSLEQFNGVSVICTNFEKNLDPAIYRRFDLKVHFDYLTPMQALELFVNLADQLNISYQDQLQEIEHKLRQQTKLVPGYFNLLARRALFAEVENDPLKLVDLLSQEQEWTDPTPKKMGFV